MNNRKTGDLLEKKILEALKDEGFRQTAGSGSVFKDGDLSSENYVGECKVKNNTHGISIAATELKKLIAEASKQGKEWVAFVENADGTCAAIIDFNHFAELLLLTRYS